MLEKLKNLFNSEDYFGQFDDELFNVLDDISKVYSTINLVALLNSISENSSINWNFTQNIDDKLVDLVDKVSKVSKKNDAQTELIKTTELKNKVETTPKIDNTAEIINSDLWTPIEDSFEIVSTIKTAPKTSIDSEISISNSVKTDLQIEDSIKDEPQLSLSDFIIQLRYDYRNIPNIYFANSDEKADKKINNAIYSYAQEAKYENVIFDFDSTFFGNATEGFLVTDKRIYINEIFSDKMVFTLDKIYSLKVVCKNSFFGSKYYMVINGKIEFFLYSSEFDANNMLELLNRILDFYQIQR